MISLKTDNWKISAIAGVIFDKDGTIIDSHSYWGEIISRRAKALATALGAGREFRDSLVLAMGYNSALGKLLPEGPIALKSRDEVIQVVLSHIRSAGYSMGAGEVAEKFSEVHGKFAGDMFRYVKVLPGALELLNNLKTHGVPCALITSDSAVSSAAILKHLGIYDCFKVVLGRESSPEPKESGKPALAASGQMVVSPASVICVGDAPMDITMAQKAGLKGAVAVATGQVSMEILVNLTPYTAGSLSCLKVGNY